MALVDIKTASGFECRIDKEALNDWGFAKAAMRASEDSGADALRLTIYMVEHMMSAEDAKRLEDHVRTEDGRVPADRMMKEVEEIFNSIRETKNSESSPE